MSYPVTVWLVLTILLGITASFAIWARGFSKARFLAVLAFLTASPIAAVSLGMSLGWPVPLIDGVTLETGRHVILGSKIVVGEAIYVLVDRGEEQPRYYRLAWSEKIANALQNALDEKGEGGEAGIDVGKAPWTKKDNGEGGKGTKRDGEPSDGIEANPFEWSWDQNPQQFWSKPQPKVLPDKIIPEEAPSYGQDV
jgi:hypothetical protein